MPRSYPACGLPLTILMPLASKDIDNACISVASMRRHILHPIQSIVVAGQDNDSIRAFCQSEGLVYLNEKTVLPAKLLQPPHIPPGHKSNGWLRQQFLKLTAFDYLDADLVLTQDADTFMVRDISFMEGDKQVFFLSDEYTTKFFQFPKLLLGDTLRHPRSFVSHSMLWQRHVVDALEAQVKAQHGTGLVDTLLANLTTQSAGSLSEFEIYGNFMHNFMAGAFVERYWYNAKIPEGRLPPLEQLQLQYRRYNSVSAHIR